jgi:hypothetical protein
MPHPLDGSRLKVIRAQEHLDSLKAEIGMYLNNDPYEIIPNEQPKPGQYSGTIRVKVPPPLRLSAVIGDCVTNCRAALDYIVWELASHYFNPRFDPKKREDRQITSFPIYRDALDENYLHRLKRLADRHVPAGAIDRIKAAQPYNGGYESLWLLHELVNSDKHRAPLLTIGHIGNFEISFAEPADIDWRGGRDHGYGIRGAAGGVQSIATRGGTERVAFTSSAMHVNAQATVYVAWPDVTVPDEPVDLTLEKIIRTVANIVPGFDLFL